MANMKLDSVVSVLRRRGFEVEAEGDDSQRFIPFELLNQVSNSKLEPHGRFSGRNRFGSYLAT